MNWIKRLGAAVGLLLITSTVYAGANFSRVKTWTSREILTYSNLNAEFDNIFTNFTPSGMDDYSASVSQMRSTADPYPASAESLPTSLAGELERIRYVIAQMSGQTYWYQDPAASLSGASAYAGGYMKPDLIWVSSTTIDLSTNTTTANMRRIIFPDGNVREVTENTNITSQYCRFNIQENASFAAVPENSGLRAGYVESANTWYALYAVKSTTDSSKFVVVGDTITPSASTLLDSAYGTNGWVYLGLIRNGVNATPSSDIIPFTQSGNQTIFGSCLTSGNNSVAGPGVLLTTLTLGGSGSSTYTYSEGVGAAQIPNNITLTYILGSNSNANDGSIFSAANGTGQYANGAKAVSVWTRATDGFKIANASGAISVDIYLLGFIDGALR